MSKCFNCNKIASYGFPGSKRKYCSIHKRGTMINITNKIVCLKCNKYASYGFNEMKYCNKHKKDDMINLRKVTFALCLDSMDAIYLS